MNIFRNILNKSKLLLKYYMPYSAIMGLYPIGKQISAKMGLQNHLRLSIIELFWKVTTKMADQDVNETPHEKTVNLEKHWSRTKINVLFY